MKIFKSILTIIGGISISLLLGLFVFVLYESAYNNQTRIDTANKDDVQFILNWAELKNCNIKSILHSYESPRSFLGDHMDLYEIQVDHIQLEALKNNTMWTQGNKADMILKKGIELVDMFTSSNKIKWFPKKEILMSKHIYIYAWTILFHHKHATAAKIIFINPTNNKIYYASVQT